MSAHPRARRTILTVTLIALGFLMGIVTTVSLNLGQRVEAISFWGEEPAQPTPTPAAAAAAPEAHTALSGLPDFSVLAEKLSPAVVNISTTSQGEAPQIGPGPGGQGPSPFGHGDPPARQMSAGSSRVHCAHGCSCPESQSAASSMACGGSMWPQSHHIIFLGSGAALNNRWACAGVTARSYRPWTISSGRPRRLRTILRGSARARTMVIKGV